jgi:hypothetical protein
MYRTVWLLVVSLIWIASASADYVYQGEVAHDANSLYLVETNLGMFGGLFTDPRCEWPQGSGHEYLYGGGLWIGAMVDGAAHVSTGLFDFELRPPVADPIATIYVGAAGMPGGQPGLDDDQDGWRDEDRLNGRDDDGDGLIDEDFAAYSQEMFACEYDDSQPEVAEPYPDHVPLGVTVHQESYGWSNSPGFYIYRFEITNTNAGVLEGVCVGLFMDPDIGYGDDYYADDKVLFSNFSTPRGPLSIGFAYDEPGQVPGYMGTLLLGCRVGSSDTSAPRARWSNYSHFSGSAAFPSGDPINDTQRYSAMTNHTGTFSGPGDMRYLVSMGPFPELASGEAIVLDVAFVIGEGLEGMLAAARGARLLYESGLAEPWVDGSLTPVPTPRVEPDEALARLVALPAKGSAALVESEPALRLDASTPLRRLTGLTLQTAQDGQSAAIRFSLAAPAVVSGEVFDCAGRRVQTLLPAASWSAGEHSIAMPWSATGSPSGVYYLRLSAGGEQVARPLVRIR